MFWIGLLIGLLLGLTLGVGIMGVLVEFHNNDSTIIFTAEDESEIEKFYRE